MRGKNYLLVNMLRSLLFGIVYSILEVDIPIWEYIPTLDYRILYFIIFAIATFSTSYLVWGANFFLSMTFEDISYWIIKNQLPFSYAWYYPVFDHIPLVDTIGGILSVVLYAYAYNRYMGNNLAPYEHIPDIRHYDPSCDMFYYFTHGKTHDLYGLLVLVVVGVIANITSTSLDEKVLSLVAIIIGTGVFVDLWSHCFHH